MARGNTDSWNVRDRHMVETLERLQSHHGSDSKGIIWAHNTHVGDARATDMEQRGRLNIGQLRSTTRGSVGNGVDRHGERIVGPSSPRSRGTRRWRR